MDGGERSRRGASFAEAAGGYERARPGYPADAARWLAGSARADVLDLGAGTGKLTRALVALGHRVVAVDPLAEMLAELRAAVPDVPTLVGSGEAIPLADASLDVVAVAQAFHWFDHPRALPEIARVLRPGGALALVWNRRDESVPWVAELSAAAGSEVWAGLSVDDALAASADCAAPGHETCRHAVRPARGSLLAFAASRSHYLVLDEGGRARMLAAVGAVYDRWAGPDGLDLPYHVACSRSTRR
ncbi:MAG: class I SAM-dependent methyltransferase [Thermoleophilia bacterium]